MKNVFTYLLMAIAALQMSAVNACTSVSADNQQTFFVSAVMKKNGEEATIKLMHSVVLERSESEALQAFVRTAIKQYPDYKMVSVLASKEASITCQKSGSILSV